MKPHLNMMKVENLLWRRLKQKANLSAKHIYIQNISVGFCLIPMFSRAGITRWPKPHLMTQDKKCTFKKKVLIEWNYRQYMNKCSYPPKYQYISTTINTVWVRRKVSKLSVQNTTLFHLSNDWKPGKHLLFKKIIAVQYCVLNQWTQLALN